MARWQRYEDSNQTKVIANNFQWSQALTSFYSSEKPVPDLRKAVNEMRSIVAAVSGRTKDAASFLKDVEEAEDMDDLEYP